MKDSFVRELKRGVVFYDISSLGRERVEVLPYSLRILLENLLRNRNSGKVSEEDIKRVLNREKGKDIPFFPWRVIMQDYTGTPLLVDLAAMREAAKEKGIDPSKINPVVQSDLVIDHSVQVDYFGTEKSLSLNMEKEFERNRERYTFLKWAQQAFKNLRIIPPGHGIIHQVNMEYLTNVVTLTKYEENGLDLALPDTIIGTDSHTTMINGIGVLGWGVGGLEAEARMLGEPYLIQVPEVVGVNVKGTLRPGVTTTDLALFITEKLRKFGVVGKFVEFFGEGLRTLPIPDRATIANMAPEYGATVGYFPVDEMTLRYLSSTGRDPELVEEYVRMNLMMLDKEEVPLYDKVVEINLEEVEPSVAGPKNPEERVPLKELPKLAKEITKDSREGRVIPSAGIAIASITSCTNTSNPSVIIAAALIARNAVRRGILKRPFVKTSFAPGSVAVVKYLERDGLLPYLEALGFHVVAFGCTTCIGNAGPLPKEVEKDISEGTKAFAVISGNRNFEGRINPLLAGTFLASPPLVVAFSLAGRLDVDFELEPLGIDPNGEPVYLKDIWPSPEQVSEYVSNSLRPEVFSQAYSEVFKGDRNWEELASPKGDLFQWFGNSTYIRQPPWFKEPAEPVRNIVGARILALLGDKVTTDHISPAGPITEGSEAAKFLRALGERELNTYGARRGDHEVMVRGGFANPKIRNYMVEREGGFTSINGKIVTIFEAAKEYRKMGKPLVIFAGKQYGTGSSRDWAAKVTALLGVKAVIAESFERIHRSNLVAMGVLPIEGPSWKEMGLKGDEEVSILGLDSLSPGQRVTIRIEDKGEFTGRLRVDTRVEVDYLKSGNILNYVFSMLSSGH